MDRCDQGTSLIKSILLRLFWYLTRQSEVRDLRAFEERYIAWCYDRFPELAEQLEDDSEPLSVLQAGTLNLNIEDKFDRELINKHFVSDAARRSILYWSPTLLGGLVAGLALIALLQMLSVSHAMKPANMPGGSAASNAKTPLVFPVLSNDPQLR